MADTTMTILGMTGAGKTCYLLGMFKKMSQGIKGYTVTTNENRDVELKHWYKRLADESLGYDRFPPGTDSLSEDEFNLEFAYKPILSFSWMDYPGNMLDLKVTGNAEDYYKVKDSIINSSCLFLCIDGELLKGDDLDEKIDRVKDNCSEYLNPVFSEISKQHQLPPIAILITKYDLCIHDTSEDELCEILEEAFSPLFIDDGEHKNITAIIPVSLGSDIMGNENGGKLKPINVQQPIFMGITFALGNVLQNKYRELKQYEKSISNKQDTIDNEKDSFFLFRNDQKIKQLIAEMKKQKQDAEQIQNLLLAMEKNRDKLLKEVRKINLVFVNGEKKESLADVIEGR